MKKNLFSKFIALATVFTLGMTIVGCGTETKSDKKETKTESTQEKERTAEEKKVVLGTVAIAEIFNKLGYKNVVGVPETDYDLGAYKDVKKIGKPMTPDAEVVKSVNPDIFFSEKSLQEANEKKLGALNINSKFLDLGSYDGIINSIKEIGNELNIKDSTDKLVEEIESRSEAAFKKTEGKTPKKVLYLFGTPKSIMVGTSSSYIGSLLKKMNINNVAGDNEKSYIPLSMENIIAENPDVILVMNHVDPQTSKMMVEKAFSENPALKNINAVKNDKVVFLDNKIFSVTGNIHVADAIEELVKVAYE